MNFEKPHKLDSAAYQEADPTSFSPAPSLEPLSPTGEHTPEKRYPIYTDGTDRYVQLKADGPRQEVVVRLLKNVLNVADVVSCPGERGTEYYSKIMPHDRIEEPSSARDIRADLELISLIFNDQDRSFRPEGDYFGAFAHNLEYEAGRVSHYDFGESEMNLEAPMTQRVRYEDPVLLGKVLEKLAALKETFAGDAGKEHFLSILRASGKHPAQLFPYSGASSTPEALYEAFVARIDAATKYVTHAQDELQREAA